MFKIKCPRCNSDKVAYCDSNHEELLFDEGVGYIDGIYACPKCHIEFGTWTDFEIKVTNHKIEWIEELEEFCNAETDL